MDTLAGLVAVVGAVDTDAPRIHLQLAGTSETGAGPGPRGLARVPLALVRSPGGRQPPPRRRDPGSGGLIATAVLRGLPIVVISVSDGEAASAEPELAADAVRNWTVRCAACAVIVCLDGSVSTSRRWDRGMRRSATGRSRGRDRTVRPDRVPASPMTATGSRRMWPCGAGRRCRCDAAVRLVPIWAWHRHGTGTTSIRRGSVASCRPLTVRARSGGDRPVRRRPKALTPWCRVTLIASTVATQVLVAGVEQSRR